MGMPERSATPLTLLDLDDDEGSIGETLSEWGLDQLIPDNQQRQRKASQGSIGSLAQSLALYQNKPSSPPPKAHPEELLNPYDDWEQGETYSAAVNFEPASTMTRGRPRASSSASMHSYHSRPVTPSTSAIPSRPGSALSRFDPGPTAWESTEDHTARIEAQQDRPRFARVPQALVMPQPLAPLGHEVVWRPPSSATDYDQLPIVDGPSLPYLGDSENDSSFEEEQEAKELMQQDEQQQEELQQLAVSVRPAGKLFGRSLMDELEMRKVHQKAKSR